MIWLAVLAVLAGVLVVIEGLGRIRHVGARRILWRWCTGRPWHGQDLPPGKWIWPGPWFWDRTRPQRAGLRLAVTLVLLAVPVCWVADPLLTGRVILAIGADLVLELAVAVVTWAFRLQHVRKFERPAQMALTEKYGITARPKVSADRLTAQVKLPQASWFDEADERAIVRTLAGKIGMELPEASWRRAGPSPLLILTSSKPSPARVDLAELMPFIRKSKEDEWIWGLGKNRVPVITSLSSESPHVGLSMGSGAGKSVTARFLAAQAAFWGAIIIVLDVKQISQHWGIDLPNVVIYREAADIHQLLLWLTVEIDRRNRVALAGADYDGNVHANVGPRLLIVAEELNATMKRLRAYWRGLRDLDGSLPVRPPSLDSFDDVNLMGRQARMNILYIGQKLSVKATGGDGDIRESIGTLALGRYKPSTWKQLAGEYAMPPSSRQPGRLQIVTDEVHEVQGGFVSGKDARWLSQAGTVAMLPDGMPVPVLGATRPRIPLAELAIVSGTGTRPAAAGPRLITLAEAVDEGIVPVSIGALRRASTRKGFVERHGSRGTAGLYSASDLALKYNP